MLQSNGPRIKPWGRPDRITAQKMKFSIKKFFSKCNQIRKMQICSHLLKKSLMENFIFYAVNSFPLTEKLRIIQR